MLLFHTRSTVKFPSTAKKRLGQLSFDFIEKLRETLALSLLLAMLGNCSLTALETGCKTSRDVGYSIADSLISKELEAAGKTD